jgi:hypothetical protein
MSFPQFVEASTHRPQKQEAPNEKNQAHACTLTRRDRQADSPPS